MKKKAKVYVVWVGKTPGVYGTWDEAKSHIQNFPGSKYKGFSTWGEAEFAFTRPWENFIEIPAKDPRPWKKPSMEKFLHEIAAHSISVDAACSGNPGVMEYRGVRTLTGDEIFHSRIFPVGTNNIGEFLAIVHALALFHEKDPALTIYTDSVNAISWVKYKTARTKLAKDKSTKELWNVIKRAETWLRTHSFNNPILKWNTRKWGEIAADFGRK